MLSKNTTKEAQIKKASKKPTKNETINNKRIRKNNILELFLKKKQKTKLAEKKGEINLQELQTHFRIMRTEGELLVVVTLIVVSVVVVLLVLLVMGNVSGVVSVIGN